MPDGKFMDDAAQMVAKFNDIGLQYSTVDLSVKADFAAILQNEGKDFIQGFPEDLKFGETCFLVMSKAFVGSTAASLAEICGSEKFLESVPAGCTKQTLEQRLKKLVNQEPIMVFIKGSPKAPECGFSRKLVGVLAKYEGSVIPGYGHFDILSDPEVREGLKKWSKWPTYPQLYVKGVLVGGIDII